MTPLEQKKIAYEALGEEIKRLEEADLDPNSVQTFIPKNAEEYIGIFHTPVGYEAREATINNDKCPKYRTIQHAQAVAHAREIQELMWSQPGIEPLIEGKDQWCVQFQTMSLKPFSAFCTASDYKLECMHWGLFATEEQCEAAIDTVGADVIYKAAMGQAVGRVIE